MPILYSKEGRISLITHKLDNWGKRFVIVNTFILRIIVYYQSNFET